MQIIRTLAEEDFGRQSNPEKWSSYYVRPSARAVLLNRDSNIALMHVTRDHYYKLPGGGVEADESQAIALERELKEEVGTTDIEIIAEVGQIDEFRDQQEMKSEHYCYIVRSNGPLVEPSRTDGEIEEGYETVWVKNIDEAIALVDSGTPAHYGQDFERLRELTFLNYVKSEKLLT